MACVRGALWVLLVGGAERLAAMAVVATSPTCRDKILAPPSSSRQLAASLNAAMQQQGSFRTDLIPSPASSSSSYEASCASDSRTESIEANSFLPLLQPFFVAPLRMPCRPSEHPPCQRLVNQFRGRASSRCSPLTLLHHSCGTRTR